MRHGRQLTVGLFLLAVMRCAGRKSVLMTMTLVAFGAITLCGYFHMSQNVQNDRTTYSSRRTISILYNDNHNGPIQSSEIALIPLNDTIVDLTFSNQCYIPWACENPNKDINIDNGLLLPRNVLPRLYHILKKHIFNSPLESSICYHAPALCDIFKPSRKLLIIIASARYNRGRTDLTRWKNWNENLITISEDLRNIIGATNLYDLEYLRYFTGIRGVLLPSYSKYISDSYHPVQGKPFLFKYDKKVEFQNAFFLKCLNYSKKLHTKLQPFNDRPISRHYNDNSVIKHPGIVYIPNRVSMVSLFEHYRMNIPLFFPSLNLLAKWQFKYMALSNRTCGGLKAGKRSTTSSIPGTIHMDGIPDPNDDTDIFAIKYWLQYADFYQWPHITYYESAGDLVQKLRSVNLKEISKKMKRFNKKAKKELLYSWSSILETIAENTFV